MLPMPNLPTDSVYKFIVVGGIALLITGLILPFYAAGLQTELFEQVSKASQDRAQRLVTARDSPHQKEIIEGIGVENEREKQHLIHRNDANQGISLQAERARIVGANMLFWGVLLWYRRAQRHQDALLVRQVKAADLDIKLKSLEIDKANADARQTDTKEIHE